MDWLILRLFIWSLWSMFAGLICYMVPFKAYGLGVANIDGKTEDLWTIMLASVISVVLVHHVQLYLAIRHLTLWLLGWCVFSVSMIPFCLVLVDYVFGVPLYRRQFSDIFGG